MPAVLNRPGSPAMRDVAPNSPAMEAFRRRLQTAIPYGTEKQIASRLGRAAAWVYDQVEGRHPLCGDVILGCLHAMSEAARTAAITELLDGMVHLDQRVCLLEALRAIQESARAAESLLNPEES